MTSKQLTCKELVELVTDYFELALSEDERARFQEHLRKCGRCRAHVSQMQSAISAVHHLPKGTLERSDRIALLDVFRLWKAGSLAAERDYDSL